METSAPAPTAPDARAPRRDPRPTGPAPRPGARALAFTLVLAVVAGLASSLVAPTASPVGATGPHPHFGQGFNVSDGAARLYPSVSQRVNAGTNLTGIRVRLSNVHHTCVKDLDVLLVAPDGRSTVLMSDAGDQGVTPFSCHDIHSPTLTFDDGCGAFPNPITEGARQGTGIDLCARPTDNDNTGHNGDDWRSAGTNHTARPLSDFLGMDPTGEWKLYVWDDAQGDVGSIGAWYLDITTDDQPPTAADLTLDVYKGQTTPFDFPGWDPDGGPLYCSIHQDPTKGTLASWACKGNGYTARPLTSGTDGFTFHTYDRVGNGSAIHRATFTIVNRVPAANPVTLSVLPGQRVALPLGGTDPDPQETVTCTAVAAPALGTLEGSGCARTYVAGATPGTDVFGYTVSDPFGGTSSAQVRVTVQSTVPVADPKVQHVDKGWTTTFALTGTDPQGQALTCVVPATTTQGKGTLTGTGCTRSFTANPRTSGSDTFTYTVRTPDGRVSAPATVRIDIGNKAPVAPTIDVTVNVADKAAITLGGTDADPGETPALTCHPSLGTTPRGRVSGEGCYVTYTAGAAAGSDSFTYQVRDPFGAMATGTVRVTIAGTAPAGCSAGDLRTARYVCRAYLDLLGRPADASGKAYWVQRLDRGESRATIVKQFTGTIEYRRSVVRGIYRSLLATEPSSAERDQWAEQLRTGLDPDEIRSRVLGSELFWNRAGKTPEGFVEGLYQQVTRRPVTAQELNVALAHMQTGITREGIAAQLLAQVAGDTPTVAGIYERFLRRTPPASETTYWVGRLQAGADELVMIRQIISGNEYYTRA